jgi:hypothetical protein
MVVRAYEQERLREAEQARLRRLVRQGRAGTGHQDITRVRSAARLRALGTTVILVALVATVAAVALLVVGGHAPTLS